MGHRLDQGDMLDFLEESKLRRLPLHIVLKNGKLEGEDHVAFASHGFTAVRRISSIHAGKH